MVIDVSKVEILDLKPGDTIVLRVAARVSDQVRACLAAVMKERFPDHKTLVLEAGLSIEVIRPDA